MVQKKYEKLKAEHGMLPEWDSINNEFELSSIEHTDFLLRRIKRKIAEKIEGTLDILEHTISPDPGSFSDVYESRYITAGDRAKALDSFRILMELYRSIQESELAQNEEEDVKLIRKAFDTWKDSKKSVHAAVKLLKQCWQKKIEAKEVLEYLG